MKFYVSYSVITQTKAAQQNFRQIQPINILEVNNSFPTNYPCNQAILYIKKTTDLFSFGIICWKTIVNLYDYYS